MIVSILITIVIFTIVAVISVVLFPAITQSIFAVPSTIEVVPAVDATSPLLLPAAILILGVMLIFYIMCVKL
jgi:hypothetical protein